MLTQWAFGLAVIVLAARAMVLLYLRDVFPVVPLGPEEVAPATAPGPISYMVLAAHSAIPPVLVLIRWTLDPTYALGKASSAVLLMGLAIWILVTGVWSSDAYATLIESSTWLSMAGLFFTLVNTTRSWRDARFIAAVVAGLLAVNVVAGLYYRQIEHPVVVEDFKENLEQNLRERGYEPGSPQAEQFLGRVERGDYGGFAASPNTLAAMFVITGFALVGVSVARRRADREKTWAWILLVPLVPAAYLVYLTQSRTALAAGFLAGIGLLIWWRLRTQLAERRRLALGAVFTIAGLGGAMPHRPWTGRGVAACVVAISLAILDRGDGRLERTSADRDRLRRLWRLVSRPSSHRRGGGGL